MKALDLFAGCGGWDIGAHALGIDPLGIELDPAACATREAAGHPTLQGDVAALDPADFVPCELLIASPPCTAFSTAGKREGIKDLPLIFEAACALALGEALPDIEEWRDARSALVLEPLRWALALQPDYLAWEQVPPVLEFWELCADILRKSGFTVWAGILYAETYGVPQTRKRAILMASRVGQVKPPAPTHQRYVSPPKEDVDAPEGLFEIERADRIVRPEDRDLLPWVSMAEALGWAEGALPSPAPTVSGGGTAGGGGIEVFAGGASRKRVLEATQRNGSTGEYGERGTDEPSFTVAPNADRWKFRNGNQENSAERDAEEPAPTIHFGKNLNEVKWLYDRRQTGGDSTPVPPVPASEPAPTLTAAGLAKGRDQWKQARDSGPAAEREPRDADAPSYTIRANGSGSHPSGVKWISERPSTNVNGDPRISSPGRHDPEESGSQQKDAIRVSLDEAAVLQSFRPDYPFQGTKSQRFLQVGNAVPPGLALPILGALLGIDWKPIQFEYLATYTQQIDLQEAAA